MSKEKVYSILFQDTADQKLPVQTMKFKSTSRNLAILQLGVLFGQKNIKWENIKIIMVV